MRKLFSIAFIAIIFNSCGHGQTETSKINLSVSEFAKKITEIPSATIIDVRTPDEFSKGHLVSAKNYDWNGNQFDKQIASLDKSKPVFVYCLSGGRSSSAANKMKASGFKTVYELNGGILKWRGANLPETSNNTFSSNGMTSQQFDTLLNSDKLVLVDFYADWCAPCKKMKPYLDEISKEMADKAVVIRINADENNTLCKALKIDALPVLKLYKNKRQIWTNTGFVDKTEILKQLQ